MKKVIILVALVAMVGGMSSCKKTCTCTEKLTGVSVTYDEAKLGEFSCKDMQDILNETSELVIELGWTCK